MTVGLLTNVVSPHQLPLSQAIAARVGDENYRYVYTDDFLASRAKMGWSSDVSNFKFKVCKLDDENRDWLEKADLVYSEERDFDLFNKRLLAGRKVIYVSERWFRPTFGWFRLLHPKFFLMASRMVSFLRKPGSFYFPQGVHAWRDMKRLCFLFGFRNCEAKFRMWGYFVEPGFVGGNQCTKNADDRDATISLLWVGRLLRLKRVDTILRALAYVKNVGRSLTLTIVGDGDEKTNLEKLAGNLCLGASVSFQQSVPISKVRDLMRKHDVYVFSSDSREGWGAVVSEAMEEGMMVLGSYEAGASATMLPDTHLFHAGDWRRLAALLQQVADGQLASIPIGDWTAAKAAGRLVEMVK